MELITRMAFGLFGLAVLIGLAWLFSNNRRGVDWKLVGIGLARSERLEGGNADAAEREQRQHGEHHPALRCNAGEDKPETFAGEAD